MAVEAVMQMKDIDKTLFSSNTMMEDDDDGGSVSSLEPLFLSDDNDQSDGKKDSKSDDEDNRIIENEDEILNNEIEKFCDEKINNYTRTDKTDTIEEKENAEKEEPQQNDQSKECENEMPEEKQQNEQPITEENDAEAEETITEKDINLEAEKDKDNDEPKEAIEEVVVEPLNVDSTSNQENEEDKEEENEKTKNTNEEFKRTTSNEEDLLQVMDVKSDEDGSENKENESEESKTEDDKELQDSCEKPSTPEEIPMDIDENNDVVGDDNMEIENFDLEESLKKIISENKQVADEEEVKETNKRDASPSTNENVKRLKTDPDESENVKIKKQEVKDIKITQLNALSKYMLNKRLEKLTRPELEEICLQKIVEVLSIHSENSELRHKLKLQELLLEQNRKEINQISKQCRELSIVHNRLLSELSSQRRSDKCVLPIKITRSVGLQACVVEKKLTKPTSPNATPNNNNPNTNANTSSPTVTINKVIQSVKPLAPTVNRQLPPLKPRDIPQHATTTIVKAATPLVVKTAPNNNTNNKTTINNNTNNNNNNINNKKADVVDLTGDDEKAPSKTVNKLVSPVTTGTRIMLMPYVTTNMKSPMLLKLNAVPAVTGANNIITTTQQSPITTAVRTNAPQKPTNSPLIRSVPSNANATVKPKDPAPLPPLPPNQDKRSSKPIPPKPLLNLSKSNCGTGIVLQWKMPTDLSKYEFIASYQLFAYQETNVNPKTHNWGKIGDVKALALPMAVTLTQFTVGNRYYFAVRAVDIFERVGLFSDPCSILL